MTQAICLRCGASKIGALTPCPSCGFDPSGEQETVAEALLLSDRYASAEALQAASEAITAGETPDLDEVKLAELMAALPPRGSDKIPIGCRIAVWIPIVVVDVFLLVGVVGYLVKALTR